MPVHELRRLARGCEGDHTRPGEQALRRDVARLRERAPARARRRVLERRVPEHDRALRARRLILVDDGEGNADEALGEGLRLGDRRRREHEPGVGAVLRAEPPQAAHHLSHVAAEDATVDVRLVEHDEAELVEELRPSFVRGEDAQVQHVGVGEEDRRRASQKGALILWRVSVVDRRDDAGDAEPGELARLVLGERLGGEEEERARLRLGGERLEDGELVAEALAAGRAGAHDDVVAGRQRVTGGGLMTVQRGHAGREERFAQRGRQVLRQFGVAASPRRLVRHGHDLLVAAAGEERSQPGGRLGSHAGVVVHRCILLRPPATPSPQGVPKRRRGARAPLRSTLCACGLYCAIRRPRSSVKNHTVPSHWRSRYPSSRPRCRCCGRPW